MWWWPPTWVAEWFRRALERKLAARRAKLEAIRAEIRRLEGH